jgi:hypothetical protein
MQLFLLNIILLAREGNLLHIASCLYIRNLNKEGFAIITYHRA